MSWYNCILVALAIVGMLGAGLFGMSHAARTHNTALAIRSVALFLFWAFIAYWNIKGFS